jgi:UDPglucose 6-dehydrogenase
MDIASAEMTKYAANAMLATRISFMNDIANLCDITGADVNMVRKGIGSDSRIGSKFLYAGCGYGGSCFPKDVKALINTGRDNGYVMRVIEAVEAVNEQQKNILFRKFSQYYNGDLKNKTVAVWGLSFKPETDDMREAPALVLIEQLVKAGVTVKVYDPVAMDEAKRIINSPVTYCRDKYEAAVDADALMTVTEWTEFRIPSWQVIKKTMRYPLIIDGRNVYDKNELAEYGIEYICIGRYSGMKR